MPVYMDLHIGQGLTAEDVAMAHQLDLKHQDKFNCKCLTYWVDEPRGNAYCLIEAPDKNAVYELHKKAHEQMPDEIIEVDRRVIKAFLGRIHDPEVVDYIIDQKIKVINDPAFRVILIVQFKDRINLIHELGVKKANDLITKAEGIIRNLINRNQGVDSEDEGDEIVATFTSAIQALLCAIDIQNFLKSDIDSLGLRTGIHAGNPVEKGEELFGSTLKLSRFLCKISDGNKIYISNSVKNLLECANEKSLLVNEQVKSLSKNDEEFLTDLLKILHSNWQNSDFEIEDCYKAMSMSKSQFYRRCVEATGTSANRLLRDFRLNKAKQMLKEKDLNVAQTAFECGYNSPSYFTKCFQKKFGLRPQVFMEATV
ncbi:hypothetical protein GCM10023115_29260 [Pontixanthobacter gangjinensis]|uniref:DUF4242 domain-containing protein n=1 Tax=Christiangramia aestuarii TaxID=1028746 RepID=A0A7K1LN50_9FLAO|nr:nickel-binding protein [Christiangramia aestuarii]MUP42158.1 DUF4242 domain-containing protein [Christiangramia aestuarii]